MLYFYYNVIVQEGRVFMKNSNKKSKRNFIKSIIPALSILMIIVAILLVVYTLDSKKFNKGRVTYNDEYTMHVLYLVMNEDEVPKAPSWDNLYTLELNTSWNQDCQEKYQ